MYPLCPFKGTNIALRHVAHFRKSIVFAQLLNKMCFSAIHVIDI